MNLTSADLRAAWLPSEYTAAMPTVVRVLFCVSVADAHEEAEGRAGLGGLDNYCLHPWGRYSDGGT